MITKQEYIALRERTAAYCAILYTAKIENFAFDLIDTKTLRAKVQDATGFPFSELAVAKALSAPDPYAIAVRVSNSDELGTYRMNVPEVRRKYKLLTLSEGSLVWQLDNISHDAFRSYVNKVRKEASGRYDIDKNYSNPAPGEWIDINIQMLDGLYQSKSRHSSLGSLKLFQRGALKPEWLSVYIGIAAIIVALWIG